MASGVININTATQEQLMSIKDIGKQRSKLIIKARAEKGKLTLDDIKLIPELPNTLWDPLVASGKIIFETEKVIEKYVQEDINKIKKDFETQVFILQQEKTTMQYELKLQCKTLQEQVNNAMAESQLCLQQLEEQKKAFHVEVLNRQEAENEDKEKLRLIIHRTQQENKELASKLEQFVDQKDIVNTKFTEEINLMSKEKYKLRHTLTTMEDRFEEERISLMNQVQEYAKSMRMTNKKGFFC